LLLAWDEFTLMIRSSLMKTMPPELAESEYRQFKNCSRRNIYYINTMFFLPTIQQKRQLQLPVRSLDRLLAILVLVLSLLVTLPINRFQPLCQDRVRIVVA